MKEQILKLLDNIEFCEKLVELKSEDEVKKHFKDNGVEVTDQDVLEIKETINSIEQEVNKLDNEALEIISGGSGTEVSGTEVSGTKGIDLVTRTLEAAKEFRDMVLPCAQQYENNRRERAKLDGKIAADIEKINQEGETARYRMKMNAAIGGTVAATGLVAVIAGLVFAKRKKFI